VPDFQSRSPELSLFAQLCGIERPVSDNIYDFMHAVMTCIDIGERGWLVALALVNVALGGNVPVPDLVSAVPPGYGKYITRIAVVDDKALYDLLPDIPLRRGVYKTTISTEKDGTKVEAVVEDRRFPRAFGVFIEYVHPLHGLTRNLWVIHDNPTGDYPFKSFLAPSSVADKVSEILEVSGTPHAVSEDALREVIDHAAELLRKYGSPAKVMEAVRKGKESLPEGVVLTTPSEPAPAKPSVKHRP